MGTLGNAGLFLLALAAQPAAAGAQPAQAEQVRAPIALLSDLGSGRVLIARDVHRRFMPASLTKIMTTYVAFELMQEGKLQPGQRFVVSDGAFRKWANVGSTMFLSQGSTPTVDELLGGIMTVSANDGCIVLAEGIDGSTARFVSRMNATARKLGMKDSHFGSPNGWPDQGATYTTAADLATLAAAMMRRHPLLYRHYVGHQSMTYNGITQPNHVPLFGVVAGADGLKTGFTNESGYGLVGSALRNGRRLLVVVAGSDTPRQRKDEARDLLEWGFARWSDASVAPADKVIGSARVQGGAARSVDLVAPQSYFLTVRRGEPLDHTLAIRYSGPLSAPIGKGQPIADLVIRAPGQPPHLFPLVAAVDVPVAGFWARLRDGLLGLIGL